MNDNASLVGQVIGNYEILRELGRGGMGFAYLAKDRSTGQDVALKFLSLDLMADEMFLKRFRREARVAAQLNHPNIVRVYAVDKHEGLPFIVMEYVEGLSLKQRIRAKGRLDAYEALSIAADRHCCLQRRMRRSRVPQPSLARALLSSFQESGKLAEMRETVTRWSQVGREWALYLLRIPGWLDQQV